MVTQAAGLAGIAPPPLGSRGGVPTSFARLIRATPDAKKGRGFNSMSLNRAPISLAEANAFVARLHRHHPPVLGHKFSIAAYDQDRLCGVVIVGRPVSRMRDDGWTLEVTRLCTDGTPNSCSYLYGAAARAAFALGYRRIGTYTLPDEGGASLRASGWHLIGERGGGSWSRSRRPRKTVAPTETKLLWEREQ